MKEDIRGNGKVIDGENNLIQSDKNFTAIIGLDNVVVVNTRCNSCCKKR